MTDRLEQNMQATPPATFRPGLSSTDLREAQRTPIQCKAFYTTLDGQGQGMIANLSKHGCLVKGDMPVTVGDKLTLVLHDPTTPHLIVIDKARVVWTTGQQFGVAHETLYPSELGQLNSLLSSSRTV
jgi:hypothetical protein